MRNNSPVIRVRHLKTCFGTNCVHEDLNFDVHAGEIVAIVGGSGSGKTTLLHELIMLHEPTAGSIQIFGQDIQKLDNNAANILRRRFGVLFQTGALFSSLTVAENIAVPLREHTTLDDALIQHICQLKLALVGLESDVAFQLPEQLSGGMIKRAALARALALDPEILFLDEPSAGLDPVNASALDELILQLRDSLGLSVVMVTHDMDTLWRTCDRVAFLGEKRIISFASMQELFNNPHPLITRFLRGPRGHAAKINR